MTPIKRSREDNVLVEAESMANCALMLRSCFNNTTTSSSSDEHINDFVCKTCNKRFPSFQALGGHRASHNKRSRLLEEILVQTKTNKMHDCSICGMKFSSGQALGGHMRRHRDESNKASAMIPDFCLDLNLTPHDDNLDFKLWPTAPVASPVLRIFI
ncbi:unnamed protein product [Withania somnifera]